MYKLILSIVFALTFPVGSSPVALQKEEPIKLEVMSRDNIERIQQVATIEASVLELVLDVKFSSDSELVALRDPSRTDLIELWNTNPPSLEHMLMTENDDVIRELNFSYDSQTVAVQQSTFIQVWDTVTGGTRFIIEEDQLIYRTRFAPHAKLLAYVLALGNETKDDKSVHLWDVEQGEEFLALPHPTVHIFAFDDDGKYLASGGADGSIRLWKVNEGAFSQEFELIREADGQPVSDLEFVGNSGLIFRIGFPPSDPFNVWDYEISELRLIDYLGYPISRDLIVKRSSDNKFQVWNINSDETLALLDVPLTYPVGGTPDQRVFGTYGKEEDTLDFLDIETGEVIKTITYEQMVFARFSDDGRYLAIWSANNKVSLWGVPAEK